MNEVQSHGERDAQDEHRGENANDPRCQPLRNKRAETERDDYERNYEADAD